VENAVELVREDATLIMTVANQHARAGSVMVVSMVYGILIRAVAMMLVRDAVSMKLEIASARAMKTAKIVYLECVEERE
jgi:hypothetical protein